MNDRSSSHRFAGDALALAWGLPRLTIRTEELRNGSVELSPRDSVRGADSPGDPGRTVVADKLARMIHIGVLLAGDASPSERDLCEVFGVARQTVRAALGILEGRLMVAISHGRRSRILGPGSLDGVDGTSALKGLRARRASEVLHALLLIDTEIASMAATNISDKALAQIDALVAVTPSIGRDPVCHQMIEYEVRTLIYGACGNELLADVAMDMYGHASMQRRRLLAEPLALQRNIGHLISLAEALRERDTQQVTQIMKKQTQALAAQPHNQDQDARMISDEQLNAWCAGTSNDRRAAQRPVRHPLPVL